MRSYFVKYYPDTVETGYNDVKETSEKAPVYPIVVISSSFTFTYHGVITFTYHGVLVSPPMKKKRKVLKKC